MTAISRHADFRGTALTVKEEEKWSAAMRKILVSLLVLVASYAIVANGEWYCCQEQTSLFCPLRCVPSAGESWMSECCTWNDLCLFVAEGVHGFHKMLALFSAGTDMNL